MFEKWKQKSPYEKGQYVAGTIALTGVFGMVGMVTVGAFMINVVAGIGASCFALVIIGCVIGMVTTSWQR
jgi:hypothetical protein